MSENILHTTCPNCGAPLDFKEGDAVAFCAYCNTMVKLREIKEEEEHYMLEITLDRGMMRTALVGDLLKVPGVPEKVRETLQIVDAKLVYIPYYVLQVHGTLKWKGLGKQARYSIPYKGAYRHISFYLKPETGLFDDQIVTIVYAGNIKNQFLENYKVATRGKRYFAIGEIKEKGGEVIDPVFDFKKAREIGLERIKMKHLEMLREEIEKVEEAIPQYEVIQIQLIHVPMWFIKWKIGKRGKTYKAIIDAASGVTLYADVPRNMFYWITVAGMTVIFLGVGLIPTVLTSITPLSLGVIKLASFIGGTSLAVHTIYKTANVSFRERMD